MAFWLFSSPRGKPQLVFGKLEDCPFCEAALPAVEQVRREAPNLKVVIRRVGKGQSFPVAVSEFPAFALLSADGTVLGSTTAKSLPYPITFEALESWIVRVSSRAARGR